MSTRSIIARATGEGTFKGVYHHWDGYPTGLGKYLTKILADPFGKDLTRMLHTPEGSLNLRLERIKDADPGVGD